MANKTAAKKDESPEIPPGSEPSMATTLGVPDSGGGKAEKRLFQNGPGEKVWMTKAEAEKAGKFWKD